MRLTRLLKKPRPGKKPASRAVRVVVGLRNPGADYEGTRHNIGFEVLQLILARSGERFTRAPSRLRGVAAQTGVGDDRTLFFAPTTFMNESGTAVQAALRFNKVPPADLLVIHDDIDLPFGRLRLQIGGGSGGHNGIRSLERSLGTTDFSRLKMGVGRPPGSMDPADYVLRQFGRQERSGVVSMIEDAADVVELWAVDRERAQEMAALRDRDG